MLSELWEHGHTRLFIFIYFVFLLIAYGILKAQLFLNILAFMSSVIFHCQFMFMPDSWAILSQ